MKPSKIIFSLALILSLISCERDNMNSLNQGNIPDPTPTIFSENFGSQITRNFIGLVIDVNQNPIENASVAIGSSIASTDANGVFIINNATIYEHFGYVKVSKEGYLHGSRSVVPSVGTNKVTIMLLEEAVIGTTQSGTSETISLSNGASVALEGNYIKEDGSEYAGAVRVIMHHLDPTDEHMNDQMPGMLYAENSAGEERMLQTFGMLAIELRGTNGEDLNLAEGSTAEIRVPLEPSLVADAPSTIPLWYFDEAQGYWKEEGEANLVGNTYIGTVSHFSFWNCDIPAKNVNLCVIVKDAEGNLLSGVEVQIYSSNYGTTNGFTNPNGVVCGLIPKDETLEISVYAYDICINAAIYVNTFGPFAIDSSIEVIIPRNPNLISETVFGKFNDCDGNPVSSGYVKMTYGDVFFIESVVDGEFEITMFRCSTINIFTLEAFDTLNFQRTSLISYTFAESNTNLGELMACDTVDEFIYYSLNDGAETHLLTDEFIAIFDYDNPNYWPRFVNILGRNIGVASLHLGARLNDSPPYTGTYGVYIPHSGGRGFFDAGASSSRPTTSGEFHLTKFGNPGDFIDISFRYTRVNTAPPGPPETIEGIVHIRRQR